MDVISRLYTRWYGWYSGGHCVSLLMRSAKPHSTAGDGYGYSPNRPNIKRR